jgi:hypothetical protein
VKRELERAVGFEVPICKARDPFCLVLALSRKSGAWSPMLIAHVLDGYGMTD